MEETPTTKSPDQPSNQLLPSTIHLDSSSAPIRRGRGRPRGSRNKFPSAKRTSGNLSIGSASSSFTSHIIMVNAEENLVDKIMAFSLNLSKSVKIISAIGSASKAMICPISTSDEAVTYEGRFEIISLSGSILIDDEKEQVGRLNVTLSTWSDGQSRTLGGRVAGVLIAATPVQIVLVSITLEGQEKVESLPKMTSGEGTSNLPSQIVLIDSPKKTLGEGSSNLSSQTTALNES